MLELGPRELEFHRQAAPKILELKLEHVLLYGERMRALFDELKSRGFAGDLRHFTDRAELSNALVLEARTPGLILIKGSRGMRMEEVWKALQLRHGEGAP
jgi:UDP-N-acetylmuramoyl-tripeptide--D-alanyl-D-alanine ligase